MKTFLFVTYVLSLMLPASVYGVKGKDHYQPKNEEKTSSRAVHHTIKRDHKTKSDRSKDAIENLLHILEAEFMQRETLRTAQFDTTEEGQTVCKNLTATARHINELTAEIEDVIKTLDENTATTLKNRLIRLRSKYRNMGKANNIAAQLSKTSLS